MKIPQPRASRLVDVCLLTRGQQKAIENGPKLAGGPRGKQLARSIPYAEACAMDFPRASDDDTLVVLYATGTMNVVETF